MASSTKIAGLIEKVQRAHSWLPPRGCAGSAASTSYDHLTFPRVPLEPSRLSHLQVSHYDKDERYMAVHDIANELSKVRVCSVFLLSDWRCLQSRMNDCC
jgi:hypothetical protein